MKVKEMVESASKACREAAVSLDRLSQITEALNTAEARLEAVNKEHQQVTALLFNKRALLDESRKKAEEEHETKIFEKTRILRQVIEGVAEKQREYDELDARVKTLRQHHDNILASIDSLRKKIG